MAKIEGTIAVPKNLEPESKAAEPLPEGAKLVYKLKKSFGYIERRRHVLIPKGTEIEMDDPIVSTLFRLGADVETVKASE